MSNLKAILFAFVFILRLNAIYSQDTDHWEMVVSADDTWHYFLGNSEPPAEWTNLSFDTSLWPSGPGGIGYGDGDDRTTISAVPSVYIRNIFNIIDSSKISFAILHVDYDDAFVAYLNGHEIARGNIGTIGIRPGFSTFANNYHEAKMYSGGKPERFIIQKDTLSKYIIEGDNVLALQVHNFNASSSDMSSIVYLSVGIKDASNDYRPIPVWFDDPFIEKSNLPLFVIETMGKNIVGKTKITSWLKVIDNGAGQLNNFLDEGTDYNSYIGIETRGQSSQDFPKKSFSIETRDAEGEGINVSLLGLPPEEDWILYAPYSDKSLLRNAITFQLGSITNEWQPKYKFCDVYINNSYEGIYLHIEKIKRDTNRVNISKLNPEEISGNDLSGGYIVKVDKIWDLASDEYFYTYPNYRYYDARNYAFTYVYPKSNIIVPVQKSYIYNYLVELENALNGSLFRDTEIGFRKYIDMNSFIDFQIMNELANNVDGYRYSTFFYKKKDSEGGKLFAGPLWDFNLGYGNVDYSASNLATDGWLYTNYGPNEGYPMHWWSRLMEDPEYEEAFAKRWWELRAGRLSSESIMANLDDMINYLGLAIDRNFERWPIIGQYVWPNYDYDNTSYMQEVGFLKNWLSDRLNWMDNNIPIITSINVVENQKEHITIFPNPVRDQINIQLLVKDESRIDIEIIDLLGKSVFYSNYLPTANGIILFKLSIPEIENGYYSLIIMQKGQIIGTQKLLIIKP